MSRIGKKSIVIPAGVVATVQGGVVSVKGKLGEFKLNINSAVEVKIENNRVISSVKSAADGALWGTMQALLANVLKGVSAGFSTQLEIQGVGFRASLKGKQLVLEMGFSHPVLMDVPDGITAKVEKNIISVTGIDKQKVGAFAAKVREIKRPEPYKGKGIRYVGEVVLRKEGKKAGAGEAK